MWFRKLLDLTPFGADKPHINREQSMRGVPVINEGVTSQEGPNGERIVYVPRAPLSPWVQRLSKAQLPPARLILDELGNAVWKLIDGKRTVRQVSAEFAKEKRLHRREAEASVVAFLNMLMKRRVLSVVIP